MSKSEIFNSIKSTLEKRKGEKKEVAKAYLNIVNEGDMYKNFITNLSNNKSEVFECKKEDIEATVAQIIEKNELQKLLYVDNLPIDLEKVKGATLVPYESSVNEMSEMLFECDASIVQAKLGVSNLGIFCVTSNEQPRLMSLLPQSSIVLLRKEDIVESMNHAYEVIQKDDILPTNVIFIAGPSRTADIELQVVLGVHGPQKVFVVVY